MFIMNVELLLLAKVKMLHGGNNVKKKMEIGLRHASHNISHICHYLVCFEINLITKKILRIMKVP